MDFVHRVSPTDIREVSIEGPLIVEEVVFTPPQGAMLDPLPSYEQATTSGVIPVIDLERMNLGTGKPSANPPLAPTPLVLPGPPPLFALTPTPGPPQIGLSPSILNQPMPGVPPVPVPSGTVGKTSDRSSSGSASLNPFLQDNSTSKSPIYVPQQPMPQPYGAPQQYPYPAQNPYMNPYQYPQAAPGMQMQSPYNPYQHAPPLQYQVPQSPYAPGYSDMLYEVITYPVMYGSGCHGYRRSSSCCSD
ncbi:hypothetical protein OSTOST_20310 [Ostertagia ostertagi]